ncbi:autotransporter domain-containing protein [Altererythrobacter aurantiacus]|uniref:Autotransporter domain-containing protein n=1 Tax=Parapontixanthobacter aurantiacus TaxID=1463599 RepID=A0A844ZC70_9SPHN|nr:autotransporter domain-containing protein [Parapontixanthobacter aurantiacus]MXO85134.1 autotransporter domain-containing protein [Parapontixanthobacter aurantiacus]
MTKSLHFRHSLVAATSVAALAAAFPASAQDNDVSLATAGMSNAPMAGSIDVSIGDDPYSPGIITRDDIDPNADNPDGSLDIDGVNGIGQMIVWNGGGSVGLCTGTLINPRTVLLAAHCVNSRPQEAYGADTGGTPIGFGFEQNARPGAISWINSGFDTVEGRSFYNVDYLWYDERSLEFGFLEADIALATLDTPAFDVPTWAMLFTPLDQQEHVTISGYGGAGTNALGNQGIDFRRRSAENFVSFLGSLDDYDEGIFGSRSGLEQNLYWTSFTDPDGIYDVSQLRLDFGVFGTDDVSLPREGTTAGGDSGGPLILDEKYDLDLVLGVLSGGGSIFGSTAFGDAYGSYSFYQPLHAFWQVIVANNPYVYATTKGGNGEWTDPGHWVQAMDPNYYVALDGELINRLPDAPGAELSGEGAKYGQICGIELNFPFLQTGECQEFDQDPIVGATGDQYFVEGGPGSENFVPDNYSGDVVNRIKPRYYDVTLYEGITTLSDAEITIDRLTMEGGVLDIEESGSLTTLGDWTQITGWTNVDGTLSTGEAFLLTGLLSGTGTFETPFFTSVAGIVAPGGADRIGTLTIDGNAILASGSALYIDADRSGADTLAVTGVLSLSDPNDPDAPGASVVFNKPIGGKAPKPRDGDAFVIATADGGVQGTFGQVYSFQGVLRPELSYTDTSVIAELRAGKFVEIIGRNNPTARAFASALDQLRSSSYNDLYNLYGTFDLLEGANLTNALASLAPRINDDASLLQEQQASMLFDNVTDRLSLMGSQDTGTLSVAGSLRGLVGSDRETSPAVRNGFANLAPDRQQELALPEGFTGFVSSGTFASHNSGGATGNLDDRQQGRYVGMGIEHEVAERLTVGVGYGYASGLANSGFDTAESEVNQVAAYGSYRLDDGAYVGLAANYQMARTQTLRFGSDGFGEYNLEGDRSSERMSAVAETGINVPVSDGLTLTPRAQLAYNRTSLDGFAETGGETALAIDDFATSEVQARLGAKLAGSQDLGNGWTFVPQMQANYVRILDGAQDGMTVRFAAASDVPILLPLANGDSNWAEVKGGVSVTRGLVRFGAGFETDIGRDAVRNDRAVADINIRF